MQPAPLNEPFPEQPPAPGPAPVPPEPARHGYVPLVAYAIVERPEEGVAVWIRCGSARAQPDGTVALQLDACPLNGEILMRDPKQGHPPPVRLPPPLPPELGPGRHLDS